MQRLSIIFIGFMLLIGFGAFANDYYWVGGSGDWTDINHWATTSGGSLTQIQTPTPNDNVFFDANSGNAASTINVNLPVVLCKTLDLSGLNNNFTFSGICSEIRIFGGLNLSNKATWSITAKFSFESQQTGNLITSNHCFMPFDMHFISITGGWILSDSLNSSNIYHKAGSFNTNGKKLLCANYISNSTNSRTLVLGNSKVVTSKFSVNGQGFTVNAGTSQIFMHGNTFELQNCGNQTFYDLHYENYFANISNMPGSLTFNDVWLNEDGFVAANCTYNILYLTKGKSYGFGANTIQHFITNLIADGDCREAISIGSKGISATFNKSSGTINISYILLRNIIATGGATFNAWSSHDLGGNPGWNIVAPTYRDLYWVGGSGQWTDSIHWSVSSGGIGGECIPTIIDNVVFDNNSFLSNIDTVSILDTAGNCHDMTWNTYKTPEFRGDETKGLKISGSLHFCTLMRDSFLGGIIFVSNDLGEVVQTANHDLLGRVSFNGLGSWTMLDSLKVVKELGFVMGKFYSNDQYISCKSFGAGSDRWKELYLTTSRIDVWTGSVGVRQDSTFIDPGTSEFHLYTDTTLFKTTYLPQRRFWTVVFEEHNKKKYSYFQPINTKFHKLIYRGNVKKDGLLTVDSIFYSAGYDYVFEGKDSIHDFLHARGYCTKKITFRTLNPMSHAFFVKTSGNIDVYRVHMRGMEADGGAVFTAHNSSDLGNNVNWIFQNTGYNLYWVDDGGEWNDSLHWSLSSGGTGGACIPTINDNVFFDQNSFSTTNNIVVAASPSIFCKSMNWDAAVPNPIFHTTKRTNLFIAGSMDLTPNMNFNYKGTVFFCDTAQNKHILSGSQTFDSTVCFIDTGRWDLSDSMTINSTMMLYEGHVVTNGHKLQMIDFNAYNNYQRTFDISNSIVTMSDNQKISTWYWINHSKSFFIATNSEVYFKNSKNKLHLSGSGNVDFNNIYFYYPNSNSIFTANNGVINFNNKVVFNSSGSIYGDHEYDTLIFSKNKTYQLAATKHQYINKLFKANGSCSQFITITGNGGTSFIKKDQGIVEVNEVIMKDIYAQGNAIFTAYGGQDNGGNTNWNFHLNPPRTLYWVKGTGSWDDTTHWSLQSGGPGGECIPTYIDDVIIDSNSADSKIFSYLSIPFSGECHNIWWKSFPGTIFNGLVNVYGGINFISNVKLINLGINFKSNVNSNLIKTGNNTIKTTTFSGRGGWKLYDDLRIRDSIIFSSGYLKTYSNYIKAIAFSSTSNAKKRLDLDNSTLSIKRYWLMNSDSLTLNAGTSNILFENGTNYEFKTFGKPASYYYNLSVEDVRTGHSYLKNRDSATVFFNKVKVYNDGDFLNNFIFDSLIFAPGNTYKFQEGRTQLVNKYWFIRGNNCYAINLQSTKMYSTANVFKPSGIVEGDFINMRDIHAKGNCTFYAGKFSTDIDNNQGWIFQNGPNYVYGLGADTSFTLGKDVVISTANFNGTPSTIYNWSTGSTHDTIVVSKTGWYWVTVTYAGNCVVVDSIYVGCKVKLNYNVTNAHCYGDTNGIIQVIIPDTNYTYSFLWSTGDTTEILQPIPAGSYQLIVYADSGRCSLRDTIDINQPPKIIIPQGDTAFCIGDSVMLDLGDFLKYYWDDGYSNQFRWVAKPDTFFVVVQDSTACKSFGDTIKVREDSIPVISLGMDTTICINSSIVLSPGSGFTSYLWQNQSTSASLEIFEPGTYWVMVQQRTCYVWDTIIIDNCPPKLTLPNVFTPNGDGYNEYFVPEEQNILDFKMKIYNRWGMRIYETTDLQKGWDGTYINQPAAEGVYFYVVEYREWEGTQAGELLFQQGTVTLLRNW